MTGHEAARRLVGLEHYHVTSLEEAIPLISYAWTVLHFPAKGNVKAALYGRSTRLKDMGIDAMVRELDAGEYVLLARRYPVICDNRLAYAS